MRMSFEADDAGVEDSGQTKAVQHGDLITEENEAVDQMGLWELTRPAPPVTRTRLRPDWGRSLTG
jgi:hypothetical protein